MGTIAKEPVIKAAGLLVVVIGLHVVGSVYVGTIITEINRLTGGEYQLFSTAMAIMTMTMIASLSIVRRVAKGRKFEYELLPNGRLAVMIRSGRKVEVTIKDKLVLITGGDEGVGYALAKRMVEFGAHVIILTDDEDKGQRAVDRLKNIKKNTKVEWRAMSLRSLRSIRKFACDWKKEKQRAIDLLINCAEEPMMSSFALTEDGFERQFAGSFLGHFLLTVLLLPHINQRSGRIINRSSIAHLFAPDVTTIHYPTYDHRAESDYSPFIYYSSVKFFTLLFTRHLQLLLRRSSLPLKPPSPSSSSSSSPPSPPPSSSSSSGAEMMGGEGNQIKVFAVDGGWVSEEVGKGWEGRKGWIVRKLINPITFLVCKRASEAAETFLFCSFHPDVVPGEYYSDCHLAIQSTQTLDETQWSRLWSSSLSLTAPSSD